MFNQIVKRIKHRKLVAGLLFLALLGLLYYGFKPASSSAKDTRYVLATAEKGTLIASVSGSGQVSTANQVDIKPKVSGDVLSVLVKAGQTVKEGDILAQIDTEEAYKTVRDARASLESAQISLEKLKEPTTDSSITQAENAVTSAKNSLEKLKLSQQIGYQEALEAEQKAEDNLAKAYEDAFNTASNTYLDLSKIMASLKDTLYSDEIASSAETSGLMADGDQWNTSALMSLTPLAYQDNLDTYQTKAESDYQASRVEYNANYDQYKKATRYSDQATIESLVAEALDTTKSIAQAAKSENDYLNDWINYQPDENKTAYASIISIAEGYETDSSTYIGEANTHLSSLLATQRSLTDYKEAITNAKRDLATLEQNNPLDLAAAEASAKEKEASLANLKAGTDDLDIKSQELAIEQRESALSDALEELADYTVRAPFSGIMASVDVKRGDAASSGTAIGTIISPQQIAEISLNEVDVAKVEAGQKTTLTFDAVESLSITGEVAEVDALGTVSQGVVTYNIKIVFDTQDERIKPGMSVSADIITEAKPDVLLVPISAVKTQGQTYYVEILKSTTISSQQSASEGVLSETPPVEQTVKVGSANDTMTEITSGLSEGDQVVVRTITDTSTTSTTNNQPSQSILQTGSSRSSGANRAGGVMMFRD